KGPNKQLSWSQLNVRPALPGPAQEKYDPTSRAAGVNDQARTVGYEMMTRYVIGFEMAGLLLTAAVVGAIALAQLEAGKESPRPQAGAAAHVATGGNGQPPKPAGFPELQPTSSSPTS